MKNTRKKRPLWAILVIAAWLLASGARSLFLKGQISLPVVWVLTIVLAALASLFLILFWRNPSHPPLAQGLYSFALVLLLFTYHVRALLMSTLPFESLLTVQLVSIGLFIVGFILIIVSFSVRERAEKAG